MIIGNVPVRYDAVWIAALMSEVSKELDECIKRNQRVYIGSSIDTQLVLVSPDGTKHKLNVANDGTVSTEVVV